MPLIHCPRRRNPSRRVEQFTISWRDLASTNRHGSPAARRTDRVLLAVTIVAFASSVPTDIQHADRSAVGSCMGRNAIGCRQICTSRRAMRQRAEDPCFLGSAGRQNRFIQRSGDSLFGWSSAARFSAPLAGDETRRPSKAGVRGHRPPQPVPMATYEIDHGTCETHEQGHAAFPVKGRIANQGSPAYPAGVGRITLKGCHQGRGGSSAAVEAIVSVIPFETTVPWKPLRCFNHLLEFTDEHSSFDCG